MEQTPASTENGGWERDMAEQERTYLAFLYCYSNDLVHVDGEESVMTHVVYFWRRYSAADSSFVSFCYSKCGSYPPESCLFSLIGNVGAFMGKTSAYSSPLVNIIILLHAKNVLAFVIADQIMSLPVSVFCEGDVNVSPLGRMQDWKQSLLSNQ